MSKTLTKLSKFLSYILRHKPEAVGLSLDNEGWVQVIDLLSACNKKGKNLDHETLTEIVETNNKKRFTFSEDGTKIRANQGHSVEVDLNLEPVEPPETLFHGTAQENVDSILSAGLHRRNRQYVHLSVDRETATNVGQRHGKPVVLVINSGQMHRDGVKFYLSKNGVWLADYVDRRYIESEE